MSTTNYESMDEYLKNSVSPLIHKFDHNSYLKHNGALKEHGITFQQSMVLGFLYNNRDNDSINQKSIENYLDLKGSSVTSLIKAIVKKGYIERFQDKNDARNYKFKLTEKAMELHTICVNIFKETNKSFLKNISEEEINLFINTLKKMIANIEE